MKDFVFDPLSDVEEVVPDLSCDIAEIIATGVVTNTGDCSQFTKETDVKKVGHYLRDKIETFMAARALDASMSAAAKASSPSPGSASGQPATPAE